MTTLTIALLICLCVTYRIRLKLAQNAVKREIEALIADLHKALQYIELREERDSDPMKGTGLLM